MRQLIGANPLTPRPTRQRSVPAALTTLLGLAMLAPMACEDSGAGARASSTGGAKAGGAQSTGGSSGTTSTGGAVATGGASGGGGGSSSNGGAGGGTGTGGRTGVGGTTGPGGAASGGAMATGGARATGGATSSGGTAATGGTVGAGGATPTGGSRPDAGVDGRTDGAAGTGGRTATGGATGSGGSTAAACTLPDVSTIQNKLSVGGGGSTYKTSDHFVVFGSTSVDAVLNLLEAAHQCLVEEWCWRSPGLSIKTSDTNYYRFNVYEMSLSGGAAGYTPGDDAAGLAYIQVLPNYATEPGVTVHEYGHALTYSEKNWIEQRRTGFWWESVANFVAESFMMSPICANARSTHGITTVRTTLEPDVTISNSYYVIVMNQNYYQAWPFLYYLTTNPDNYSGLGKMAVPNLMRTYKLNSNETPLHTLERLAAPATVQTIVGRYWARMAYLDIGDPKAQQAFMSARGGLNFRNLSSSGTGTYTVIAARQPRYFGSNIIPLKVSGDGNVSVQVTNLSSGQSTSGFVATLSIRATSGGAVRYVDLPSGSGQATIASGEEASLVVVNAPAALLLYDPSSIPTNDPVNTGLNYQVQLTGATPAN